MHSDSDLSPPQTELRLVAVFAVIVALCLLVVGAGYGANLLLR